MTMYRDSIYGKNGRFNSKLTVVPNVNTEYIIKRYEAGERVITIAKEMGLSVASIIRCLKENEVYHG